MAGPEGWALARNGTAPSRDSARVRSAQPTFLCGPPYHVLARRPAFLRSTSARPEPVEGRTPPLRPAFQRVYRLLQPLWIRVEI